MNAYAILCNPGHNRVYFEASLKMAVAEFNFFARTLPLTFEEVECKNIGGVDYLTFKTNLELKPKDVEFLTELSFIYALFKIENIGGEELLKPIDKAHNEFVDESIGSLLKYTGKTNEIFTRMMINIARCSQNNNKNIKLLDPVAGKGTTLFEGLVKGYDVYGVEIGEKIVTETYHFLKKFLETAKYKFDYSEIKISGVNKSFSAQRHTFSTAKTKEDFKNKNTKTIEIVSGNSMFADKYFKRNFFDIIVGDLPYGVQHGNVTNEKQSSLTRNPSELLEMCLPSWAEVLKPGGVIVLAWNKNVLPREQMKKIFEQKKLKVLNDEDYIQFEHRVDRSILRDIIAARK